MDAYVTAMADHCIKQATAEWMKTCVLKVHHTQLRCQTDMGSDRKSLLTFGPDYHRAILPHPLLRLRFLPQS